MNNFRGKKTIQSTEIKINGNDSRKNDNGQNKQIIKMEVTNMNENIKSTELKINGNDSRENDNGQTKQITKMEITNLNENFNSTELNGNKVENRNNGNGQFYVLNRPTKLRVMETYNGYIEVYTEFPGYTSWKYRAPHTEALKVYNALCEQKIGEPYHEIYNVLRLMKWSLGQNDFTIPMSTYVYMMEFIGQENLKSNGSFERILRKLKDVTQGKMKSTIWSQHRKYSIYKRVVFRLRGTKIPKITSFDEFYTEAENMSLLRSSNNFNMINSNVIMFRFNQVNYRAEDITLQVISNVAQSIHNQEMDLQSLLETASVMATLKVTEQNNGYTFYEDIIVNYLNILIDNLRQITVKASIHEIITGLGTIKHIIPISNVNELREYKVMDVDDIKSLFVRKDLEILTREGAEQVEKEEGILVNGKQVKFYMKNLQPIHITQVTVEDTREMEVLRTIVNALANSAELRNAIIQGYDLSKTFTQELYRKVNTPGTDKSATVDCKIQVPDDSIYIHMTKELCRVAIANNSHPGLLMAQRKMINEMVEKVDTIEDILRLSDTEMLQTTIGTLPSVLSYLKLKERYARTIGYFVSWSIKNVFSTVKALRELLTEVLCEIKAIREARKIDVRDNIKLTTYEEHGILDVVTVPFKVIRTNYNRVKGAAGSVYETVTSTSKLSDKVSDAMDQVKETARKFAEKLDQTNMTETSKTILQMDMKTFKSAFETTKNLLSSIFTDVVAKIGSLVGIESTPTVDAYQLFIYYLLWKNTDCKITKTFIVLDIMASFGILDKIWEILTYIFNKTVAIGKSIFSYTDNVSQQVLEMEQEFEQVSQQAHTKFEKQDIPQNEVEETFFANLIESLERGTPAILSMLGTAALVVLGIKATTKAKTINFTDSLKSIGLMGLAVSAIPRIYQNILKVVVFVVDQAKGMIVEKHQTKLELTKRIGKFLQHAIYVPGLSDSVFMADISYCFKFMAHYAEMLEINKEIHKIESVELRSTFISKKSTMEKMFPTVEAAIAILLPKHEMFHIQIASAPGLGKTDLSNTLMKELHHQREECIRDLMKEAEIDYKPRESDFSFYPSNDALKFMDNYKGQNIMYVDESNITEDVEQDQILMNLMMSSGSPVISNQASLLDKGRILDIAIKVSNTNNAFIRPKGVISPEAIWRRRELFELMVKPEYLDTNKKLDKRLATTAIMSKSQHLLVRWLDPIDTGNKLHPKSKMNWMEVEDFLYFAKILYKSHFYRENNRANVRSPKANYLKLLHTSNMAHLYNTMLEDMDLNRYKLDGTTLKELSRKIKTETQTELLRMQTEEIEDEYFDSVSYLDAMTDLKETLLQNLNSIKGAEYTFHKDCRIEGCKRCKTTTELQKTTDAIKEISELTSSYLLTNRIELQGKVEAVQSLHETIEHGMLSFDDKWSAYKLQEVIHEGNKVYMLRPSRERVHMIPGEIDWTKVKVVKINDEDRVVYTGEVTRSNTQTILYHLVDLSCYSKGGAEAKVKIALESLKVTDKASMYKEHLRILIEDTYNVVTRAIKSIFDKIFEILGNGFIAGICGVIGVFVMFATLVGIGKLLSGKNEYEEHGQYTRQNRSGKKQIADYYPHHQIEEDNIDEDLHLYKSMIKIQVTNGITTCTGTGVSVEGYVYLINRHVAQYLVENSTVRICDVHKVEIDEKSAWRRVNIGRIVYIPNCDAALVHVHDCRMLRSSLKHFITEDDLQQADVEFGNTKARVLMACTKPCAGKTGMHKHSTVSMKISPATTTKHKRIYHFMNLENEVKTSIGDSGSLVVHDNYRIQHKVLGIYNGMAEHQPLTGVCGIITQEELRTGLKQFKPEELIKTYPYEGEYLEHHALINVMKYDNVLMKSPIPNQSVSKALGFQETGCFVDKVDVEPAIQAETDKRFDPTKRHFMAVSLNKDNGDLIPFITLEEEKEMQKYIESTIKEGWDWTSISLYTTEQAVNGVRKVGSRPIDIHSSAGLPYKLRQGVIGKQPYIRWSEEQQKYIIMEEIKEDVNFKESLFKEGSTSRDFKVEFRKHEIVGRSKIYEKPKTRTVGMGNLIDQIMYDKCFKDMHTGMKSVYRNGGASGFIMGLDLETHADQLVKYIEFTDYILDYDVVAWEEKFTRQIGRIVLQAKLAVIKEAYAIRRKKLPERLDLMVLTLLDDSIFSNVIYEDTVRTRLSGLLSGWPGTLPDNSKAHHGLIYLIVRRILIAKGYGYWLRSGKLKRHMKVVAAADDVALSLSPELRLLITPEEIQQGYLELGYEITAPDKTPTIKARTIYEIEFLKHNFFKDAEGKYQAKIMEKVIYQLLAYTRTSSKLPVIDQMKVNIQDAMRFAFWHGETFYEELREQVNQEFAKFGISWTINYTEMGTIIDYLIETEQRSYEQAMLEEESL